MFTLGSTLPRLLLSRAASRFASCSPLSAHSNRPICYFNSPLRQYSAPQAQLNNIDNLRASLVLVSLHSMMRSDIESSGPSSNSSSSPALSTACLLTAANGTAVNIERSLSSTSYSSDEVADEIMRKGNNPLSIIGFGVYVYNEKEVREVSQKLRERGFQGSICYGGPEITFSEEHLPTLYPFCDYFVKGAGEPFMKWASERTLYHNATAAMMWPSSKSTELISTLLKKPSMSLPAGTLTRTSPDVIRAGSNYRFEDSAILSGHQTKGSHQYMEFKSGCPFSCSYCQHHNQDEIVTSKSFEQSRAEIDFIFSNNIPKRISVVDPVFNMGNYIEVFSEMIRSKKAHAPEKTTELSLQVRPERIKTAFIDKLLEGMAVGLEPVVEIGVQTLVKKEARELDRSYRSSSLQKGVVLLSKAKIPFEVSLMYGLPHQTVDSFRETIEEVKSWNPKKVLAFPLMLTRGSELYKRKQELQLFDEVDVVHESKANTENGRRLMSGIAHVTSSPSFTRKDWNQMREIALGLLSWTPVG